MDLLNKGKVTSFLLLLSSITRKLAAYMFISVDSSLKLVPFKHAPLHHKVVANCRHWLHPSDSVHCQSNVLVPLSQWFISVTVAIEVFQWQMVSFSGVNGKILSFLYYPPCLFFQSICNKTSIIALKVLFLHVWKLAHSTGQILL